MFRGNLVDLYKREVLRLRRAIGKEVSAISLSKDRCHNCRFDSFSKTSSGLYNEITGTVPFSRPRPCPVCKSTGYENKVSKTTFLYASVIPYRMKNTGNEDKEISAGLVDIDLIRIAVSLQDATRISKSKQGTIIFDNYSDFIPLGISDGLFISDGSLIIYGDYGPCTENEDYILSEDGRSVKPVPGGLIYLGDEQNIVFTEIGVHTGGKTIFDICDYIEYDNQKYVKVQSFNTGIKENFNHIIICKKSERVTK